MASTSFRVGKMLESLTYTPPPKPRKEKKLSVVFRQGDGHQVSAVVVRRAACWYCSSWLSVLWLQHCAGVNSVALSEDGLHVYSASRDATVMRCVQLHAHRCRAWLKATRAWSVQLGAGSSLSGCTSLASGAATGAGAVRGALRLGERRVRHLGHARLLLQRLHAAHLGPSRTR